MTSHRMPFAGLVGLMLLAPVLRAGSLVVPDDFATIQAAIDAAADGDEVVVKAGLYTENLSITDKTGIVLRGQGKVVLRPTDVQFGVQLQISGGSGILVQKLSFQYGSQALIASKVAGLEVRQCTFSRCFGSTVSACVIGLAASGATVVSDCVFEQCLSGALKVQLPQGGSTLSITDNVIEAAGTGIGLSVCAQAHVSGNSVRSIGYQNHSLDSGSGSGCVVLFACTSADVVVEGNLLQGGLGMSIRECDGIVISGNQIKDSALGGIKVDSSTGVSLVGNTISGAGLDGIEVSDDALSLQILDNVISKNRNVGIRIDGSALCKGNTISQCSFDGLVITGDDSSVLENVITKSGRVGLILSATSESNTLTGNTVTGSRAFDLQDASGGANVLGGNTIGTTAP